jgi:hypothetical protein
VLFFHGISCDERVARRILREGLRPFRKPWIEPWLVGSEGGVVFLSCSPTAGRGGDPLSFALGRWGRARAGSDPRRTSGWIFVVELPTSAIRASVPNLVLERHFRARAFRRAVGGFTSADWRHFARRADQGPLRERLEHVVLRSPDGLDDPVAVDALSVALAAARSRSARRTVARAFGVGIEPVDLRLSTGFRDRERCFPIIERTEEWLDRETIGRYLEEHARWHVAHAPGFVEPTELEPWRSMPVDPRLARELRPDFLTCSLAEDLTQPDVQVVVDHVPPSAIVGLVRISADGRRLSPHVRDVPPTVGIGLYREARALARTRRLARRA